MESGNGVGIEEVGVGGWSWGRGLDSKELGMDSGRGWGRGGVRVGGVGVGGLGSGALRSGRWSLGGWGRGWSRGVGVRGLGSGGLESGG